VHKRAEGSGVDQSHDGVDVVSRNEMHGRGRNEEEARRWLVTRRRIPQMFVTDGRSLIGSSRRKSARTSAPGAPRSDGRTSSLGRIFASKDRGDETGAEAEGKVEVVGNGAGDGNSRTVIVDHAAAGPPSRYVCDVLSSAPSPHEPLLRRLLALSTFFCKNVSDIGCD